MNNYFNTVVGYCDTYITEVENEANALKEKIALLIAANVANGDKALARLDVQLLRLEQDKAKLLDARAKLLKPHKGKRQQESLRADEETFDGYVDRLMSDDEFRDDEAFRAEIERLAADKVRDSFYKPHKFIDGEWSAIILNDHSMELMRNQEAADE